MLKNFISWALLKQYRQSDYVLIGILVLYNVGRLAFKVWKDNRNNGHVMYMLGK